MTTATATRTPAEWVDGFTEGWRAPGDADSFADHFDALIAPDIRLVAPQVPTTVGREAFREQFARPVFELIPDLHARVDAWAQKPDGVVVVWFTLAGTVGGKQLRWPCIDRITLRNGVAVERVAYFDPLTLLAAVARSPRSWPAFARMQALRLRHRR